MFYSERLSEKIIIIFSSLCISCDGSAANLSRNNLTITIFLIEEFQLSFGMRRNIFNFPLVFVETL